MVASYEISRRRVQVSLLPSLAHALAVSVEALIGEKEAAPGKRGPAPKQSSRWSASSASPRPSNAS
jgi:hypothetical protein